MIEISPHLKIITNDENGDILIVPDFGVGSRGWNNENKYMRSLHVDKNGNIVSCGWPKFLNLGEGSEESGIKVSTFDLIKSKDIILTSKEDGSLIIRYIRNNCVCFRTRGSFEVGLESWQNDLNTIKEKYPKIFDPQYYPEYSLLFEYVSPNNKIVLNYTEPNLIFIGGIKYGKTIKDDSYSMIDIKEMTLIANNMSLDMVYFDVLSKDVDITKIIEKVIGDKSENEGIVLRFNNCQEMVKVKSEQYVKLHALKSNLDTTHMIDIWLEFNRPDFKIFREKFEASYDFETYTHALPIISSMFDGIRETYQQVNHVSKFVESNRNLDRKSFALESKKRFNGLNESMCFMFLDKKPLNDQILKKLICQKSKYINKSLFKDDDEN